MWKRLISLSMTLGIASTAPPALAQVPCASHEAIVEKLTNVYEETRIGRGLQSPTSLFEIWRSPENGSWTIVLLRPEGKACVIATGFAWSDENEGLSSDEAVFSGKIGASDH